VDETRTVRQDKTQRSGRKREYSAFVPCECGSRHKTTLVLKRESVCRPAPRRVAVAHHLMIRLDATASHVEDPAINIDCCLVTIFALTIISSCQGEGLRAHSHLWMVVSGSAVVGSRPALTHGLTKALSSSQTTLPFLYQTGQPKAGPLFAMLCVLL
jgi:hypothetical protein